MFEDTGLLLRTSFMYLEVLTKISSVLTKIQLTCVIGNFREKHHISTRKTDFQILFVVKKVFKLGLLEY